MKLNSVAETGFLRIGELSRRVGAPPALLRSWERRYALFRPSRSANGYRLYSPDDIRRAVAMQAHLARGVAAAEAAELAREAANNSPPDLTSDTASDILARLLGRLRRYEEAETDRLLERSLLTLGLAEATQTVILPFLVEVGACWERAEVSVAEEHFATQIVRRRLLRLADGWDQGGPVVVLSCAPGEQHDIGLLCFGLALHHYHGWAIRFLGADVPVSDLSRVTRAIRPRIAVTSAVSEARFFSHLTEWQTLGSRTPLAIAGPGANQRIARLINAAYLPGDPISAASSIAAEK